MKNRLCNKTNKKDREGHHILMLLEVKEFVSFEEKRKFPAKKHNVKILSVVWPHAITIN